MALETKDEIGIAALATVTVGGIVYYLTKKPVKAPETAKVVVKNNKPILVKTVQVNFSEGILKKMSDEKKLALGSKANTAKAGLGKLVIVSPIRLSDNINLDYIRNKGLLGRLVAQYYAFERTRLLYMSRTGAYSFCDDTPTWLQRGNQLVHKSDIDKALKNPKWFGVGLENKDFLDRYDGGTSKSVLWRRRYSLETTFSNWSAPPLIKSPAYKYQVVGGYFFDCNKITEPSRPSNYLYVPKDKKYYKYFWNGEPRKCGPNLSKGGADCIDGYFYNYEESPIGKFFYGDYPFGLAMADLHNFKIIFGYSYPSKGNKGEYDRVCPDRYYHLSQIPWRNFKGVTIQDRIRATYTLPVEHDHVKRFKRRHALGRYYTFGYFLVRTVLDVLCARGECAEDYPEFATHCTWWFIPQPNKEFVARYPDLTALGGGVQGLADIESKDLIKYVMSITPKPGTIAPWEDRGPLYTWPESTGYLQPLPLKLNLKERETNNAWGTIVQYILSLETSICANMASGFVDTALDAALDYAESVMSEWISEGIEYIMDNLDSPALSAAIKEVKSIIKDVAGFAANMSRFVDAEQLFGFIDQGLNTSKVLTEYLDLVSDGAASNLINNAKNDALAVTDSLRRQWDWADELIGSAASVGTDIKNTLNSSLKDLKQ